MKRPLFACSFGIHTAITAVLALSSGAKGQDLYYDTNGTTAGFGNFGGAGGNWNGTNSIFNTDPAGGGAGAFSTTTSSSNSLFFSGNGSTSSAVFVENNGSVTVGSIDFANTANLVALSVVSLGSVQTMTVTGAITDSGAGSSDIRVRNITLSNAASVLTASSITTGSINFAEESFTNAQFWTTAYDMTLQTQFLLGRGNSKGTFTQNAGTISVADTARGINFNSGGMSNTTSTRLHSYIMNGGQLQVGALGVNTPNDGNNNTSNNWSSTARLEFNAGTIRTAAVNSTLNIGNGLSFKDYTGTGTKDMQYNTHLPLTVVLSQTGTRTLDANGANSNIIITPGAQMVDKLGEAGSMTKTGLGNLILTGGGPVAVNSWTGATTVTAGKVTTDFSLIGGRAATGGTDNLSNAYSAASPLVLNGGNFELKGRSSAAASSENGITLPAGTAASALNVTVASTAGLVVGQSVTNPNLPTGTYIRRILSSTQIELSAMSTSSTAQPSQTLNFGAASFNNTQTINSVDLQMDATATVTPGVGTSSTLLSFGTVSGSGGLTKAGTGTLELTGGFISSGPINVIAGTLLVNGSLGDTTVTVANGATLGGSGTVGTPTALNTLTVNGTLAPGNSTGILTVNDNLDLNGLLRTQIQGVTAGTGYDQLTVNGAVDLSGSTLSHSFDTFTPSSGDILFVLLNDGTDAITGMFNNLPQDATFASYGGYHWKISYQADSANNTFSGTPGGNDIALMAVPIASGPTASTDEGGMNRYLWRLKFEVPENINPLSDDDGDGVSNLDEARSLTNPFDAESKFLIQNFTEIGSNRQLTWSSEKGLGYILQSSTNLKNWKNEGARIMGTGGPMSLSVTDPVLLASSSLFLRIAAFQNTDTDADGLMDWQEEIIGANPLGSASLRAANRGGDSFHLQSLMEGANPYGGLAGTNSPGVPSEENASRFLMQASMGPTPESIQDVRNLGYEAWINDQFTKSLNASGKPNDNIKNYIDWIISNRSYGNVPYYNFDTRADMPCQNVTTSWLRNALWSDAQLRQRVAWALSQIFVVSGQADNFFGRGDMLANFYDVLSEGAFGNYEDLLLQVAIHPAMGVYLSHIFNLKADPAINRYPDENFAREIMQLFSIGLNQLNIDGSPVLDGSGNEIPTYDTGDIKEMARVFTGLQLNGRPWGNLVGGTHPALSQPMVINSLYHDTGSKTMPDGTILPANADGMVTIENAVAWLSNHPNTAPFICRRLIQFLVTSNPTPAYIQRVSSVFVNNGTGERGDLGAVVKAILLDPEARGLNYLTDPYFGRLKEPMLRLTNTARVLEASKAAGPATDLSSFQYWNFPGEIGYGQHPMHAPSVFNFYDLRFQLPGEVTDRKLISPEFQILDSVTATSVINRNIRNLWAGNYNDFHGSAQGANGPMNDWSKLTTKSAEVDTDSFCDHVLLLWGTAHSVSFRTREEMKKAVNYQATPENLRRAHNAAFFALTAPECAIQR